MSWQYILMKDTEQDIQKAKEEALRLGMSIHYKLDWRGGYEPKNPKWVEEVTGLRLVSIDNYKNDKNKITYMSEMCQQLILQPQVNGDGFLLGCCANTKRVSKKNVFEQGLINVLNGKEYIWNVANLMMGKTAVEDFPCSKCLYNSGRII